MERLLPVMTDKAQQSVTFTHREIMQVFSGVALAMLMAAMDQTIVATAMPTMAADLGNLGLLPWVVTAYLLASTATTPIYGKLSDLYGRKRILQISILLFLAGSVLCAVATSMLQLILFRGIQGLGGGGLMVMAFTIIGDVVSPRERGRYQGYIGGVFALASIAGPVLGGLITEKISWHWIFLINLPIGVLALAMTSRALGRLHPGISRPSVDYIGAALLIATVSLLMIVISHGGNHLPWNSPLTFGLIAATVVFTGLFLWHESRTAEPIMPLRLFRDPVIAVANPVIALSAMTLFAGIVFLPMHLQLTRGSSATESGLLLLPLVIGMTFGSAGGGRLISRTGRYKRYPLIGLALSAVVYLTLGLMPDLVESPIWSTLLLIPLGLGLGLVMPVMSVAVQNVVQRRDLGAATSSIGFFRSLGGTAGIALFGAILNQQIHYRLDSAGLPGVSGEAVMRQGIAVMETLPDAARATATQAFEQSFSILFLAAAGIAFATWFLAAFLREVPLATDADRNADITKAEG